ncbi:hypothetical protein ACWCOV_37435 [Kribbella sp. NPDC002412]
MRLVVDVDRLDDLACVVQLREVAAHGRQPRRVEANSSSSTAASESRRSGRERPEYQ